MSHRLRKRYGHSKKTFGKVPIGGLFQLKDDPENATLQKVGPSKYKVLSGSGRGLVFVASKTAVIKRGRQS